MSPISKPLRPKKLRLKDAGECTSCYGKGYSSYMDGGTTASPDFFGDEGYRTGVRQVMHFCPKCPKGKQLEKDVHLLVREVILDTLRSVHLPAPPDKKVLVDLVTWSQAQLAMNLMKKDLAKSALRRHARSS